MASQENSPAEPDENDKKDDVSDQDHHIQEALQNEFHQVWDEIIKPAFEQLKLTTEELLNRFSDFEDDFRGYLRERKPDFEVDLLDEIYGDTLRAKTEKNASKQDDETG